MPLFWVLDCPSIRLQICPGLWYICYNSTACKSNSLLASQEHQNSFCMHIISVSSGLPKGLMQCMEAYQVVEMQHSWMPLKCHD